VRTAEHAPGSPFRIFEHIHGLSEIVERGAVGLAERPPVIQPCATRAKTGFLRRVGLHRYAGEPLSRESLCCYFTHSSTAATASRRRGARLARTAAGAQSFRWSGAHRRTRAARSAWGSTAPGARLSRARVRKSALAACKTLASRAAWCYCSHAVLPFHLFGCKHQPCARFECSDQLRRVVLVFFKAGLPMLSMLSLLLLGA
jgi:hypothetical protein